MTFYFICLVLLSSAHALNNGLAVTPQMGWNSWYSFGCGINETIMRQATDLIIENKLEQLGYVYINVDDCWAKSRNSQGVIQPSSAFPSGMKALADYVHSKGLKFGLYSDAGNLTCGGRPGSLGYETIDAQTYAKWGVDYLKYDNCFAPRSLSPQARYPRMRDALNHTGRPILFSMCEWGVNSPWLWAQDVGNSWRMDSDSVDCDPYDSIMREISNSVGLSKYAGPGGWNDPDIMLVGCWSLGMGLNEDRTQMAMWSLLKAPLIIGCDLATMGNESIAIISSKELIAVNQDPLGIQGDLVWHVGPLQIWAGPIHDGSFAFVMLNGHSDYVPDNANITLDFEVFGGSLAGSSGTIRDLYAEEDVGFFTRSFTASIAAHDVFAGRFIPLKSIQELDD